MSSCTTVIPLAGPLRSSERVEHGREGLAGARVDLQQRALVERRRAAVHDRERPRLERQACDRPHLERRADDEQEPRAAGELASRAPSRRRAAARRRGRRPASAPRRSCGHERRRTLVELREHGVRGLRPEAGRGIAAERIEPCTSTTSWLPARVWSRSMFCVTTACDEPASLELRERLVRGVRLRVAKHVEALAVEAPHALGIPLERVDATRPRRDRPPPRSLLRSGSRGSRTPSRRRHP